MQLHGMADLHLTHQRWRRLLRCTLAFFLYDYLITFDREVNSFWHGATSGATVLFLSNRYLNVSVNILGMIEFGQFSDTVGGQPFF